MDRRLGVVVLVLLAALAAILIGGCAPVALPGPYPAPESMRRAVRTVRVDVVAPGTLHVTRAARGAGEGMVRGAGIGAVVITMGDPRGLFLSPLGAFVGAIVGGFAAHPRATVEGEETALRDALVAADLPARLRRVTAREIAGRTDLVVVENDAPADARVELCLLEIRLDGDWAVNPALHLIVPVRTRLVREVSRIHEHHARWVGTPLERGQWLADDAYALRVELEAAAEQLADRIVDDLFLVVPALPR